MPRHACSAPGGYPYHTLNRAVAHLPLFHKEGDYEAFEPVLAEAQTLHPTRILAYCLMPNHWHFVLWPCQDHELTAFLRWLTHTHTMRWQTHYHTGGTGHLYQGRFKSFPIEADDHLYTVLRYVERGAWSAEREAPGFLRSALGAPLVFCAPRSALHPDGGSEAVGGAGLSVWFGRLAAKQSGAVAPGVQPSSTRATQK